MPHPLFSTYLEKTLIKLSFFLSLLEIVHVDLVMQSSFCIGNARVFYIFLHTCIMVWRVSILIDLLYYLQKEANGIL